MIFSLFDLSFLGDTAKGRRQALQVNEKMKFREQLSDWNCGAATL